jgi:hypothetical protein
MNQLPTMAEVKAMRRDFSKGKTRLEVKVEKVAAAEIAWTLCKKAVDLRDGLRCRCCKRRLVVTLELKPWRSEHHHLVKRRKEKALLTDPRNVIRVCLRCHKQLEAHEREPFGKATDMFTLNGTRVLNADRPLTFSPAKKAAK